MKYIVAILVIVTILHDISLWRLNHKVDVMTEFFSSIMRKFKEYEVIGRLKKRSE